MSISFKEWLDDFVLRGGNPFDITDWPETYEGGALIVDRLDVTPSTSEQVFDSEQPYDGYKKVVVSAVTSEIDANILAENIKKGVSILGVEGNFEIPIQTSKTATPTTNVQVVRPDDEYQGLGQVIISAVDPTQYYKPEDRCNVTPTTSAQNITPEQGHVFNEVRVSAVDPTQYQKPEDVASATPAATAQTIVPEVGHVFNQVNVAATPLQTRTVTPTTMQQIITPTNGNIGMSQVTVTAAPTQVKTVTPTTSQQTITPTGSNVGFSTVTINPAPTETRTVTPTSSQQVLTPSSGKVGFSRVTVNAVNTGSKVVSPTKEDYPGQSADYYSASSDGYTGYSGVYVNKVNSSIDSNIQASNIKKDVTILGVTGTLAGGGIEEVSELPSSPEEGAVYELVNRGVVSTSFGLADYNLKLAKAVKIGDYIYIITPQDSSVYKYNPLTGELTLDTLSSPSLGNRTLFNAGVQAIGDKIYIFGGNDNGDPSATYSTSILIYDTTTHTCQELTSQLTYAVYGMATVVYNGKIWLFGGKDNSNYVTNAVQKFDPSTNTLTYVGSLMTGMTDMAACTDGSYIYLLGGKDYMNSMSVNCEKIEISSDESSISDMPYASLMYSVAGASAVYYQDTIYLIGNYSNMVMNGPVFKLNKTNLSWEHVEYPYDSDPSHFIPTVYYYNSSVVFGDNIYSVGGVQDGQMYTYNAIYKISDYAEGIYTQIAGVWYNITDPSGIVEVSELPTVGEEDKIYRVVETEVSDEGNYTTSSNYDFRDACAAKFGDYIYFFSVRDNMSMTPIDLKYSIENKTFTQLNRGSVADYFNKCAVVGNYIYLFDIEYSGTGTGHPIYKFDPSTDTYTQTISSISFNAQPSGTVCYPMGTDIVIVSASNINNALVYDTINDITRPEMVMFSGATTFSPMYNCASCIYNNSIYIFGLKYYGMSGYEYYTLKFTSGNFSSGMYTYKFKAELITATENIGDFNSCGVIGNKAYIFGGYKSDGMYYHASDAIYEFNLETDSLSLNSLTLPEECYNTFTVSLDTTTLYIMAEQTMTGNPSMASILRAIYTFSSTVDSDYVYRNNAWLDIINGGGGSGGIEVDKVSNLSASGTVISWTAPDVTSIAQYNPQLAYSISINGSVTTTTTQTSIDLAEYISSGNNNIAVTVVLTYTDVKNETITITGRAALIEVTTHDLESASTRIWSTNGILGFVNTEYHDWLMNSYIILGGCEYDQMTGEPVRNQNIYKFYDYPQQMTTSGDIPTLSELTIYKYYDGAFIFSTTDIYKANMTSSDIVFTNLNVGYNSWTMAPAIAEGYIPNGPCYLAFGGLTQNGISDSIYKLTGVYDTPSFSMISPIMPEPRCFSETLAIYESSAGTPTKIDIYIIGGYNAVGSTPEDLIRATSILKYDALTDTFYQNFNKTIPSNIQIPIGYNVDGRMSTHKVQIQGKTYFLGKDTTDNLLKLFEWDYTNENLKPEGIPLTNQNIKAIDTYQVADTISHACAFYSVDDGGYDRLYFEKIFNNTLDRTVINNNYLPIFASKPERGLTYIKNNHMYTITTDGPMSSSAIVIDTNLTTGNSDTLSMSGTMPTVSSSLSLVSDENYAYLVDDYVYRLDFENRSVTSIAMVVTPGTGPSKRLVLMHNGKIYAFGGYTYDSTTYQYTDSSAIYKVDLASGQTEGIILPATLSHARYNAFGVVSGHYAYIIGGSHSSGGGPESTIEQFDFGTETFVTNTHYAFEFKADYSSPSSSSNFLINPVFYVGNKVYIKPYNGEVPYLVSFDTTLGGFIDESQFPSEHDAWTEIARISVLVNEDYWKPMYGNDGSSIYVVSEKYESGTETLSLIKYE